MATQVTNYQCPACTGPLHFVGESGQLECEYCNSAFEITEIEALYEKKDAAADKAFQEAQAKAVDWDTCQSSESWELDETGMKAYNCPSCGAELICDATTAATACPYCGNPTIVPGQLSGIQKPDYVLPFRLDKKAATEALKAYCKGKVLLPKVFAQSNHIEEIKGVYVPFWLFDASVDASADYHATRSRSYRRGDYLITDTHHYAVYRRGTVGFSRVPVDASTKMADDYMDSVEPFDYSHLKEFSTAYLPGFFADKYDVSAETAASRATVRCEQSALNCLRNTVMGYETVIARTNVTHIHPGKVEYALLPVWLLTTKWDGKTYLFAINGQTGKIVGDLPIDKKKERCWFWGVAVGASLVLSILLSGTLGSFLAQLFG